VPLFPSRVTEVFGGRLQFGDESFQIEYTTP
jgi:hypothetical protein